MFVIIIIIHSYLSYFSSDTG